MTGFESKRDAAADKLQEPVDIASIIACREMLDAQPVPARTSVHETLKLALEALEQLDGIDTETECVTIDVGDVIDAIKEALAQPAQEPVGFMNAGHVYELQQKRITYGYVYPKKETGASVAVYTTPPQRTWIWLSDADIAEVVDTTCQYSGGYEEYLIKKAERKIKELNT